MFIMVWRMAGRCFCRTGPKSFRNSVDRPPQPQEVNTSIKAIGISLWGRQNLCGVNEFILKKDIDLRQEVGW
jgi:hypothetical protein